MENLKIVKINNTEEKLVLINDGKYFNPFTYDPVEYDDLTILRTPTQTEIDKFYYKEITNS